MNTDRPCIPPPAPERTTEPDLPPAGCRETWLPPGEGMAVWVDESEEES